MWMRDFFIFLFSPNEQRAGGGGGALPDFFFFPPCSADHERDWPPCKVVFFGLATNALNMRNNNNNNNIQRIVFATVTTNYGDTTYIYNGGFLLEIIPLTLCDNTGNRFNTI